MSERKKCCPVVHFNFQNIGQVFFFFVCLSAVRSRSGQHHQTAIHSISKAGMKSTKWSKEDFAKRNVYGKSKAGQR